MLRALLWADLFALLGAVAGTALITWEYIQTPYDLTEDEETEMLNEILQSMKEDPLVSGLHEETWTETQVYPQRSHEEMKRGLDFIYERLIGTHGITIKEFTHPTLKYSILVFFLADGLEGWPDTIHGGIISSMLLVAAERHIARFYLGKDEQIDQGSVKFDANFHVSARPADICSIIVPPASTTELQASTGEKTKQLVVAPMMLHMESAPKISEATAEDTQKLVHTLKVPTSTSSLHQAMYAMATLECQVQLADSPQPENP